MTENNTMWVPRTLWWIITARCNLDCKHCYIKPYAKELEEINVSSWKDIMSEARNAGINNIYLTGGEPFLIDMEKLLEFSKKYGLPISDIETNALILKKDVIEKMDKSTVFHISYDSFHADSFGNSEEYHSTIRKSIRYLTKRGFEVRVNTATSKENVEDINEYYERIKNIGISEWDIFFVAPIGRGKNLQLLDWGEEVALSKKILDKWKDERPMRLRIGSYLTGRKGEKPIQPIKYLCEYCKDVITLLPNGKVLPCCRYIAIPEYYKAAPDIKKKSIQSIIENSWIRDIKLTTTYSFYSIPENSICKSCSMNDICGFGCPVNAYIESGVVFRHEEKHCKVMKRYYEAVFSEYDFRINGGPEYGK